MSKKIKYMRITPEMVLDLIRSNVKHIIDRGNYHLEISMSGIPDDATVHNISYDFMCDSIVMTLKSDEFPLVEEGCMCEQLMPQIKETKLNVGPDNATFVG